MVPDPDSCYRAVLARDPRFDGRFVVGSRTTGVYCRPACASRRPARRHAVFFASVGDAERDGLRACLRCAPGATVPARSFVTDAAARIESGALDEGSIDGLARSVGVTARHLRRAMQAELGVSPVELAQSRRLAFARQLVEETSLAMTEVAFAAGFRSVRRFNALFAAAHDEPPSAVRARAGRTETGEMIALRLPYRGALDWGALRDYLAPRVVPGVERFDRWAYTRSVAIGGRTGTVAVYPRVDQPALIAEISIGLVPAVVPIVARLRRLFDLDANADAIGAQLARDRALAPRIRRRPGVRVPGAFDGFELAAVAIAGAFAVGALATAIAGRFSNPYAGLTRLPLTARAVAGAGDAVLAAANVTGARAAALRAVARAVRDRRLALEPAADVAGTRARLAELGVAPDALELIAMRALRCADAMPARDLGITPRTRAGLERARPWRAYAALALAAGR